MRSTGITNEAPLSVYIEVAYEQIAATRHTTDRLNGTRRYDADIARELAILNRAAKCQRDYRAANAAVATIGFQRAPCGAIHCGEGR